MGTITASKPASEALGRELGRRTGGFLLFLLFSLGAVFILIFALGWWALYRPMPQTKGTLRLPGLKAAVQVERDSAGIPHLRAQSVDDLYLAQGYVTAQDRLWQLELLRRVARGEVSEIAGAAAFPLDVESRTLGLRAAAESAATHIPEDQQRWLDAYARGVNEFVSSHADRLPVEFRLLGTTPRPWVRADSAAIGLHMFRILTTTWKDEIMKAKFLERIGPERTADLMPTRTDRDHPPGEQVSRSRFKVQSSEPKEKALDLGVDNFEPGTLNLEPGFAGSNNWVVSGAHSASGRAMLANDPHLEYAVPSIWYTVHLEAPGMNVAGVSLPGLPAVIIGHNNQIAWGMTNLGADVQDLYKETFATGNPRSYLVDGQWQEAQIRNEIIHVRGERDRTLNVPVTRHGPLIVNLPGEQYALRWVALEPGVWRFPFPQMDTARNWEEFSAALKGYPGPAQNFVYADAAGNIGYYGAGLMPVRPKGDGSLPLRGDDSANDWTGYIPFEQLPHVYNPLVGIIATANGRIVPDGYPYTVATRWDTPDRTGRIYQLLDPARKFTPADFRQIQMDVYSPHHHKLARALAEAVAKSSPGNPRLLEAAEALRAWDGRALTDSYAATLAHFARQELLEQLLDPVLGDLRSRYSWRMVTIFLENVVVERPARWLPPKFSDYDQLLTRSLAGALEALQKRFGTTDMVKWRWGRVMETTFAHPIGGRLPVLKKFFSLGPFEQPGTSYTVKQTTLTLGPSMRMVVDFADLNAATLTLTTGESGHPLSPHYRDQFPSWLTGEGMPLSFTASAPGRDRLTLAP